METLIGELDTRLKGMLQPLLTIEGWEVNSLTTEDFSNLENFNQLVEKYRTSLPGAFLSFPSLTFQKQGVRVPHFTADYQLLVGAQSRLEAESTFGFVCRFMERSAGLLALKKINDLDLPCNLDYIQLRRFNSGEVETDAGRLAVALLAFSIEVRNWQVN